MERRQEDDRESCQESCGKTGYNIKNGRYLDPSCHHSQQSALVSHLCLAPKWNEAVSQTHLENDDSPKEETYTQPMYLSRFDIHEDSSVHPSSRIPRVKSSSHAARYPTGCSEAQMSKDNETFNSVSCNPSYSQHQYLNQTTGSQQHLLAKSSIPQYPELQTGTGSMVSNVLPYSIQRYLENDSQSHEIDRVLEQVDRYFPPQSAPHNSRRTS
ncbi:hypothetical protein MGYG_08467 [Nannizzia gypsea CBS 118893]|uniref:Uncharacterized protein n=1 Tax=Arthroderma gypseum (strain ATCC MYA-4604 / CBS 118893) TaxID=535722 RepID=E4V5S9_ARTGP|nr:hypothetical protein MGYG_08467 [Nannizzia gypsea CBS 118893]EFR05454.1 hypothetical protein MGYG_08467 [Nannizzia gypsea CBS 118893]